MLESTMMLPTLEAEVRSNIYRITKLKKKYLKIYNTNVADQGKCWLRLTQIRNEKLYISQESTPKYTQRGPSPLVQVGKIGTSACSESYNVRNTVICRRRCAHHLREWHVTEGMRRLIKRIESIQGPTPRHIFGYKCINGGYRTCCRNVRQNKTC